MVAPTNSKGAAIFCQPHILMELEPRPWGGIHAAIASPEIATIASPELAPPRGRTVLKDVKANNSVGIRRTPTAVKVEYSKAETLKTPTEKASEKPIHGKSTRTKRENAARASWVLLNSERAGCFLTASELGAT